ncbi:hypothetical protein BGW38_001062 [Lunasporangiospora selenospora]|uniref:Uncharacterized protein n=1 Tax=Lunasporangiospora selenospora TaxID=979761 RepID=A0A9P6G1D4_9FUNG|nr:hypothetical protein BGW38_001062 [Lunasporangiospora selenospora]
MPLPIPSVDALSHSIPSGFTALGSIHRDSRSIQPSTNPYTVVAHSVQEPGEKEKDGVRGSATVGVPTAVARSMLLQTLQFWYRVPIKLFRPMRVDYLVMARAATMGVIPTPANKPMDQQTTLKQLSRRTQFFRATSIGMITHAIQTQGSGFIFRQVLPPLVANSFIGSVLYTTYIFTLPIFHPAATYQKSRTFPPPPFYAVFMAGACAGAAQSLVAAPMDSLKVKFQVQDLGHGGRHKSMAAFAVTTLKELGLKTDSLACGLFFAVFEWVKQQGYYYFIDEMYGARDDIESLKAQVKKDFDFLTQQPRDIHGITLQDQTHSTDTHTFSTKNTLVLSSASVVNQPILVTESLAPRSDASTRPYFLLEPTFVLLAGAAAAIAYQAVDYPLEQIKAIFYAKDSELQAERQRHPPKPHSLHLNASARPDVPLSNQLYRLTWEECKNQALKSGGWGRFLYSNFVSTAIRSVPAASVGFLVFEVMKRKLDARRYEHEDREMASYLDQMMVEREAERRAELRAAMEQERLESGEEYQEAS